MGGSAARRSWPRRSSSPGTASRPGTATSPRSRRRRAHLASCEDLRIGARPGLRSTARPAGPGGPASGSACRPSPRRSSGSPRRASTSSTTATSPTARRRAGGRRLGDHHGRPARPSVDLDGADRDRLSGRPGDDPSAEQLGPRRPRAAQHPRAVRAATAGRLRAGRRDRSGWVHLGIEASKLAMADRDAHLADPAMRRHPGRAAPRRPSTRPSWRPGSTVGRAAPARPSLHPRGGGTIWLGVVDGDGNAVSLIESNYARLRLGHRRPGDRHRLPEPRARTSASIEDHPNVLGPGRRTAPHPDARDALPRRPAVGRGGLDGRRCPAPDPRPGRVGARRRTALDVATAWPRPRWFVEPDEHFAPPVDGPDRAALPRRPDRRAREIGHPVTRPAPFDSAPRATATRSSSWTAVRSTRMAALAAATDPRSAGLPAVH